MKHIGTKARMITIIKKNPLLFFLIITDITDKIRDNTRSAGGVKNNNSNGIKGIKFDIGLPPSFITKKEIRIENKNITVDVMFNFVYLSILNSFI